MASIPKVTFVVPCYKLAHYLTECIHSILSQTYEDLEVLIMDDASPDNTSDVARSFNDTRVKHVRNEQNLGHLRNYNKGIHLSRGKYIWLISADDRLRRPYALKQYVTLMERYPEVGYVFCSCVGLENGRETGILEHFYYGSKDKFFRGATFALKLIRSGGGIASPSAMTRRQCYEKYTFPLDMPHLGDLYLWCMWAFSYDVAYVAEPLVCYRIHQNSMMQVIRRDHPSVVVSDDMNLLWNLEARLREEGYPVLAKQCRDVIANRFAFYLGPKVGRSANLTLSDREFEDLLATHVSSKHEQSRLRARVYAGWADRCYRQRCFDQAQSLYTAAVREDTLSPRVWLKYLLLRAGWLGISARDSLTRIKDVATLDAREHHKPGNSC